MIGAALITSNSVAAEAISQFLEVSPVFHLTFSSSSGLPAHELIRLCRMHDPYLLLVDANDMKQVIYLAQQIRKVAQIRAAIVAFRSSWIPSEVRDLEGVGVNHLLRDPFSWEELEPAAYEAIHQRHTVDHAKILAFMPAKAGAGCSTVALNTAGALANHLGKKVILIDSDRRSGIISILLNLARRNGLLEALRSAGDLTGVEWEQHVVRAAGIDLLLADPARQAHLPTWADYYQLLNFLESRYDYIVVDLPEVVNPATAEVVRSAGSVFVVCTTEIPSIKMAQQRFRELADCGIASPNMHLLVNRLTRGGPTADGIARLVGRPEFATIPNDYTHVQEAVMASRLASPDSPFAKGCLQLARKAVGLQPDEPGKALFSFLRNFSRVA